MLSKKPGFRKGLGSNHDLEVEVVFSGNPDESGFWDAYLNLCVKQLKRELETKSHPNSKWLK